MTANMSFTVKLISGVQTVCWTNGAQRPATEVEAALWTELEVLRANAKEVAKILPTVVKSITDALDGKKPATEPAKVEAPKVPAPAKPSDPPKVPITEPAKPVTPTPSASATSEPKKETEEERRARLKAKFKANAEAQAFGKKPALP